MAGLASYAFTTGGLDAAVLAFASASLVLVALVFAAAFGIGSAEERTVTTIKAQTVNVKRWGGGILIAIGTWFLLLALFADFFASLFPV